MVDLVITAANVAAQGGALAGEKTAAAAITAGQVLTADANQQAAIASDASATLAQVIGIALHGAASGQPAKYHISGDINVGATLEVGKHYCLSTNGNIAPVDDIETGDFPTYIGFAISASILRVKPLTATVAAAGDVT